MTDSPTPPSDDSQLPKRHRMSLEALHKDTSEADLWDLDGKPDDDDEPPAEDPKDHQPEPDATGDLEDLVDLEDADEPTERKVSRPATESVYSTIPEPKPRGRTAAHQSDIRSITPKTRASGQSDTRRPEQKSPSPSPLDVGELDDIGELDDWDAQPAPGKPADEPVAPQPDDTAASEPEALPAAVDDESATIEQKPVATTDGGQAEKSPRPSTAEPSTADAATMLKSIRLSRGEMIGLTSLAVLLLGVAAWFLIGTLAGLPKPVDPHEMPKLPARGQLITISKIDSHWRVPVTTGDQADTVQRGTELIPVLEITASGEAATLRVQFRNSDGTAVGDPVTRSISGESQLTLPSTAGLEDINTHNAYRTNLIAPWTAEIMEAGAGGTFAPVVTVPISTNRR